MAADKTKKALYYVYAIKSHTNGLWYIGLTADPAKRRRTHIGKRPDLYSAGHTWKILAMRKSMHAIGALEAKLIKKYKTLWPGGNNMRQGGLTGNMLKYVRNHGVDADSTLLQEGSVFSAATLKKMSESSKARHQKYGSPLKGRPKPAHVRKQMSERMRGSPGTFLGKRHTAESLAAMHFAKAGKRTGKRGPLARYYCDKIAARKILSRIASGIHLEPSAIYLQRQKAWKRFDAGLPAIPGTEHYLLAPRKRAHIVSDATRKKMSAAGKIRAARERALSTQKKRKSTRPRLSQDSKDNISAARIRGSRRRNLVLSYKADWHRWDRAWRRKDAGLLPRDHDLPYLSQPRTRPRRKAPPSTHAKRSATMKAKFARWRAEGIPMPRPPAGSRGKMTQEQVDKLSATRVRKSLTEGLVYGYAAILKCSAKAKKRQKKGLSPIPGTECFVRLQTAPTKGPKYTSEQRLHYRSVMIERVNEWLRKYAIAKGWRKL